MIVDSFYIVVDQYKFWYLIGKVYQCIVVQKFIVYNYGFIVVFYQGFYCLYFGFWVGGVGIYQNLNIVGVIQGFNIMSQIGKEGVV